MNYAARIFYNGDTAMLKYSKPCFSLSPPALSQRLSWSSNCAHNSNKHFIIFRKIILLHSLRLASMQTT